jgi:hypothetical protein
MTKPESIDTSKRIKALLDVLKGGQFDYADEKKCQSLMNDYLAKVGLPFEREFQVSGGIIDFFLPRSGLGIEVKAGKNWSRREVFRQCERYCNDDRIRGLVLATGRSQALPETINDKPVRVLALGEAFL